MCKRNSNLSSFFLIFSSVLILDQISKFIFKSLLAGQDTVPIIPGFFHLTLVHNTGAAFGLFKGATAFFVVVTLACLSVVVLLLKRNAFVKKVLPLDENDGWIRLSLALVAAGAFGNLLDRLRYSYVVDFFDFRIWPVFNVADSAITIGGIILFFKLLKTS
jgi:signal peptidase II